MTPTYLIFASILPFWWRFWQCINKYFNHNSVPQLYKAGKYFFKIIPSVIVIFYEKGKNLNGEGFKLWLTF
jgi:hypothetical protein